MSDQRGHARVDTLQGISACRVLVHADFRVLHDTTFREEVLHGLEHLSIHRRMALAAATDDDDVVLAPNEVRAVANRCKTITQSASHIRGPCAPQANVRGRRTDRGLELVSCQNPNLDTCILEVRNCLGHTVLKAIFDSCRTEENEPMLDFFRYGFDLFLAVIQRDGGRVIPLRPILVFVLCLTR